MVLTNPLPTTILQAGDKLIVLGRITDREETPVKTNYKHIRSENLVEILQVLQGKKDVESLGKQNEVIYKDEKGKDGAELLKWIECLEKRMENKKKIALKVREKN